MQETVFRGPNCRTHPLNYSNIIRGNFLVGPNEKIISLYVYLNISEIGLTGQGMERWETQQALTY